LPKRKKIEGNYGNNISDEFTHRFVNRWTGNHDKVLKINTASLLLLAEGGSLIQVLVSDNPLYNGVFHLERFEYSEKKVPVLRVLSLDSIHSPSKKDLKGLLEQLPRLCVKYQGVLNEPLDTDFSPLENLSSLPELFFE